MDRVSGNKREAQWCPYSESVALLAPGLTPSGPAPGLRRSGRVRSVRYRNLYKDPRVAEINQLLHMPGPGDRRRPEGRQHPTIAIEQSGSGTPTSRRERDRLLAANGSQPTLDEKPSCASAGTPAGWVQRCASVSTSCPTQEQIKEPPRPWDFGEQTFELFDFSFYSDLTRRQGRTTRKRCVGLRDLLGLCPSIRPYQHQQPVFERRDRSGKDPFSPHVSPGPSLKVAFRRLRRRPGPSFSNLRSRNSPGRPGCKGGNGTRRYLGCNLLTMDDLGAR